MVNSMNLARETIEIIRIFEADLDNAKDPEKLKKHIDDMKRDVRKYLNRPEEDRRYICGEFDSAVMLITLPECIRDKDDAKEYFEEYEFMEIPNSPYDCTGKLFTNWYKVFERNGRWMAYHGICMDV